MPLWLPSVATKFAGKAFSSMAGIMRHLERKRIIKKYEIRGSARTIVGRARLFLDWEASMPARASRVEKRKQLEPREKYQGTDRPSAGYGSSRFAGSFHSRNPLVPEAANERNRSVESRRRGAVVQDGSGGRSTAHDQCARLHETR